MHELNALALFDQLSSQEDILKHRNQISRWYYDLLNPLAEKGFFRLMSKKHLDENIHEFYLILDDEKQRVALVKQLNEHGIEAMFHYIPLHGTSFGKLISKFKELSVTENIAESLLRLPVHNALNEEEVSFVSSQIIKFF